MSQNTVENHEPKRAKAIQIMCDFFGEEITNYKCDSGDSGPSVYYTTRSEDIVLNVHINEQDKRRDQMLWRTIAGLANFSTQAHDYWKTPAVPRHVLQMLICDEDSRVLVMHRSNNVRSARNVWSIPTGEHEIGETIQNCLERELEEEYGLKAEGAMLLDQYENIAGDEAPPHYHWVLSIYAVFVKNVTLAINKEPEKHDEMIFPYANEMNFEFFDTHKFHPSLHDLLAMNFYNYMEQTIDYWDQQ